MVFTLIFIFFSIGWPSVILLYQITLYLCTRKLREDRVMIWNGDRVQALMSGFDSHRSLATFFQNIYSIFQNISYLCIGVGTSGMRAIPRRWASRMYRSSHSLANPHAPGKSSRPLWAALFVVLMYVYVST